MPIEHDARPTSATRVARGAGYLLPVRRCAQCGHEMSEYLPISEATLDVVEIVCRFAIEGRSVQSGDVADCLEIAPETAAKRLLDACEQRRPLLTRSKLVGQYGGFGYVYSPTIDAALYVRSAALARDLHAYFDRLAQRAQRRAARRSRAVGE